MSDDPASTEQPPSEPDKAGDAEPAPAPTDAAAEPEAPEAEPASDDTAPADTGEMRRRWRNFTILSLLALFADQITKIWARASLPTMGHATGPDGQCLIPADLESRVCVGRPVSVIESFWHWRLSMNPGSAFGLFSGGGAAARYGLTAVGIVAVFAMLTMLKKARVDQKVLHWALALIAAGAVGNLIDRIYYGVVTDFILWHLGQPQANGIQWELEWPVFNVADIVLVIGVGLMVIDMIQDWRRDRDKKRRALEKARARGLVRDL
jgi:signal peptidase II